MRTRIAIVTSVLLTAQVVMAAPQSTASESAVSSDTALSGQVFAKTRMVVTEGKKEKEIPVHLAIGPAGLVVSSKKRSAVVVDIPSTAIRKAVYEYGERRRIKEGGLVMAASIGAGAVVMFTKSKSHWLTIEHDTVEGARVTVLHLDKKNFGDVIQALESMVGRQVRLAGEGR